MVSAVSDVVEPQSLPVISVDQEWPTVSVIMTVRNEQVHLAEAIAQALGQDYPQAIDLVVAVGPSVDLTRELAEELAAADPRITVIPNPSGQTPQGLNAAIKASRGEILVRVDGHAILPPGYIRTAVETLQETGADNVGGIMDAQGLTPFEQAVACAMRSRLGVGQASFHVGGAAGPADTVYLGVFRRSALERVGGYDEHFQRAQDWEMNHRIRSTGGQVWFTPKLRVTYRPRGRLRLLGRQYLHYGRWRRVVARRHQGTINLRYLTAPAMVIACVLGLLLAPLSAWALLLPGGYLAAVSLGSVFIGRKLSARAWPRLPLALITMHWCWGWGFLSSPKDIRG